MCKILYETPQKVKFWILFQKNFDINFELDDLHGIEDSRISFGVGLSNYQMSHYEEFIKLFLLSRMILFIW
jgi:hypothetical protein